MGAEYIEIKPKQKSLAKARAVQGSDLKDSEKFVVEADKPLLIDNYDVGEHGHYTVHLWGEKHETVGDSANIWPGHYESFPELLKAKAKTVLKKDPKKQSSELSASELMPLNEGQMLLLRSVGEVVNKCVEVEIVKDDGSTDKWWAFLGDGKCGHVSLIGTEPNNKPEDKPTTDPTLRKEKKVFYTTAVPGISKLNMYDPISTESAPNIFWYEALHHDGKHFRCPKSVSEVQGMIRVAKEIQKIRNHYNRAITINSFFRPEPYNRNAGGARMSRHKNGDAVDYNVQGLSPYEVRNYIESTGFVGGLASSSVFVHQDTRNYNARWAYGF